MSARAAFRPALRSLPRQTARTTRTVSLRAYATGPSSSGGSKLPLYGALGLGAAGLGYYFVTQSSSDSAVEKRYQTQKDANVKLDYQAVYNDVAELLESEGYDDGSCVALWSKCCEAMLTFRTPQLRTGPRPPRVVSCAILATNPSDRSSEPQARVRYLRQGHEQRRKQRRDDALRGTPTLPYRHLVGGWRAEVDVAARIGPRSERWLEERSRPARADLREVRQARSAPPSPVYTTHHSPLTLLTGLTYSDLWTLAGVCAVQEMGGPKIPWRPGRQDGFAENCTPDGRLPDGDKDQDHLRYIFYRMGFNDQEIVALSGAHALGRCHKDRSGFDGPW